ncbi:MAG TPA: rhomboid family intramembrane serine protease [Pyrinomonadaceae bacterium]|nr:rhomboid family intramembrane serine protease [Pyrinomonadaceae bacterium]
MLFPIGDDNSDLTRFPFVNYVFIAANIIVYVLFQGAGGNEAFTYAFSVVPREIITGVDISTPQIIRDSLGKRAMIPLQETPIPVYGTILTSMFMHGGLMHLGGNLLYLWIFGDNLEDRLGHIRYAIFYLICGVAAAMAQVLSDTSSVIPMLGASGAISGVLGGYLLLFPRRNVTTIIFYNVLKVPAFVALGIWIVFQIVRGYLDSSESGGVAYMAHIGGFIAGFLLIKVFAIGTKATAPLMNN